MTSQQKSSRPEMYSSVSRGQIYNLTQDGGESKLKIFQDHSQESIQQLDSLSTHEHRMSTLSEGPTFTTHNVGQSKRSQTVLKKRPNLTEESNRNVPLNDYGAGNAILLIQSSERDQSPYSQRQIVIDPVKQYNKKKVSLPPLHGISETNLKLVAARNYNSGDPTLFHSITEAQLADAKTNSAYRLSTLFRTAKSPKRFSEDVTLDKKYSTQMREHDNQFYQPPESAESRIRPTDSIYTKRHRIKKPNLLPPMSKVMEVKDLRVTNTMKGDRVSQGQVQQVLESYREYYPRSTMAEIQPSNISAVDYQTTPESITRSSSDSKKSYSPQNKFISPKVNTNLKREQDQTIHRIIFKKPTEEQGSDSKSKRKSSIDVVHSSVKKRSVTRLEPEPVIWNYSLEPRHVKVFNIPNERIVLYVNYRIPKDAPNIELLTEVSKTNNGKFYILVFQRFKHEKGTNFNLFDDIQVKEMWQLQAIELLKLFDNNLEAFIRKCVGFNARRNKVDFSKIGRLLAQQESLQKSQLKNSLKIFQNKSNIHSRSLSRTRKSSTIEAEKTSEATFWHQDFNPSERKQPTTKQSFSISLTNMNEKSPENKQGQDLIEIVNGNENLQLGDSTVAVSLRQEDSRLKLLDKEKLTYSKTPAPNQYSLQEMQRNSSDNIQAAKMFDADETKINIQKQSILKPSLKQLKQDLLESLQSEEHAQTGKHSKGSPDFLKNDITSRTIEAHSTQRILAKNFSADVMKNYASTKSLLKVSEGKTTLKGMSQEIAIQEDSVQSESESTKKNVKWVDKSEPARPLQSSRPTDSMEQSSEKYTTFKTSSQDKSVQVESSRKQYEYSENYTNFKTTSQEYSIPADSNNQADDSLSQQVSSSEKYTTIKTSSQYPSQIGQSVGRRNDTSEQYTTFKTSSAVDSLPVDSNKQADDQSSNPAESSEKYTTIRTTPAATISSGEPDIKQASDPYEFKISLRNLKGADLLSQADAYVLVHAKQFSGEFKEIHKTEVIDDNNNPDFKDALTVEFKEIRSLRFSVYDKDLWKDDLIGFTVLNFSQVRNQSKTELEIKLKDKVVGLLILTKVN